MRRVRFLALLPCLFLLGGCLFKDARVGVSMPPGLLYKHTKGPMTAVQGPPGIILPDDYKTGTATFSRIDPGLPGLSNVNPALMAADVLSVGWGDGAWKTAMENGGLSEAWWADYEELEILAGIYSKYRITVYGR